MSHDPQHFAARVLQDALNEGLAKTWERRARAFDAARSRPGDYMGRASQLDVARRDRRLAEIAQACRNRASVSADHHEGIDADVWAALGQEWGRAC